MTTPTSQILHELADRDSNDVIGARCFPDDDSYKLLKLQ
jgi:hypothetical protein